MRRNCKPSSSSPSSSSSSSSLYSSSSCSWSMIFGNQLVSCSDPNQIKIFCSDATELQAISILWVARRGIKLESKNDLGSPFLQLQAHGCRGLSFKKSLQKFFQKRKERMQASMPY